MNYEQIETLCINCVNCIRPENMTIGDDFTRWECRKWLVRSFVIGADYYARCVDVNKDGKCPYYKKRK